MVDFFIFIKEQQRVEILLDNEKRIYGVILSVVGDKVTIVTEQKINLKKGEIVEINTYSENGVYSGASRILDYKWEYKKRIITASYPHEIKHSQRREYLRANIVTDFELQITSQDDKKETITGKTRDICGQGVSFLLDKPLSQFSKYNVKIKIKNREILSSCQLVYTKIAIIDGKPRFINAFVLAGITIDDKKFVIEECMQYHLKRK